MPVFDLWRLLFLIPAPVDLFGRSPAGNWSCLLHSWDPVVSEIDVPHILYFPGSPEPMTGRYQSMKASLLSKLRQNLEPNLHPRSPLKNQTKANFLKTLPKIGSVCGILSSLLCFSNSLTGFPRSTALITWLITHWSGGWSHTYHMTDHVQITWIIMKWSRGYPALITWISCPDHVADHTRITWRTGPQDYCSSNLRL